MVANKKKTRPPTEKMRQFAINMYTIGSDAYSNGTESARQAGYKGTDNYLAMTASRLIRNDKIKQLKDEIQTETAKEYQWNQARAIQVLTDAYDLAVSNGNVKDIVACARELSAITGLHTHTVKTEDVSAPSISEEERARLDLIARNYNKGIA